MKGCIHVRSYSCNTRGKSFKCSSSCNYHKMGHINSGPYTFVTRRKSFGRPSELSIHEMNHTNVRPYACVTCRKSTDNLVTLLPLKCINQMRGHKHVFDVESHSDYSITLQSMKGVKHMWSQTLVLHVESHSNDLVTLLDMKWFIHTWNIQLCCMWKAIQTIWPTYWIWTVRTNVKPYVWLHVESHSVDLLALLCMKVCIICEVVHMTSVWKIIQSTW